MFQLKGYNTKMGGGTDLSLDITKLYAIVSKMLIKEGDNIGVERYMHAKTDC